MKRLSYIFFAVTIFAACNRQGASFTVSGKINATTSDMVYLQELSYTSADIKPVDSVVVGKDGSYTLKGTSPQQNLFVIGFKDNPTVILVNDAKDIKIDFDPAGTGYPVISGSEATKELYGFIKDYRKKDSVLMTTYRQVDTINPAKMKDSAFVQSLQQQYMAQLNDLTSLITGFVNRSNNPAAISFVLDRARSAIPPDELKKLAENVAKRFPMHTGITAFKTTLAAENATSGNGVYGLLNQEAPDLTMNSPEGKKISISNYRGKYVLVDFWASWCSPCRQENPNVVAAYNKFKNKNFTILGVSLDDDKAAWMQAIHDDNLTWTHMSDLQSPSEAATKYQFNGIPFNVLINPEGKIIASGLRGEALEQKLSEVLSN